MAIVLQVTVTPATREQCDELDDLVGQAMERAGGPPEGLMSHVVFPDGDGFVIVDVWRSEAEVRSFVDEVLLPPMAELGLTVQETRSLPAWSFARP